MPEMKWFEITLRGQHTTSGRHVTLVAFVLDEDEVSAIEWLQATYDLSGLVGISVSAKIVTRLGFVARSYFTDTGTPVFPLTKEA